MKVVVQRVANASVSVDGKLISEIGKGICVLVGLSKHDTTKDVEYMNQPQCTYGNCICALFSQPVGLLPRKGKILTLSPSRKLLNLRVFEDSEGKRWARGVRDAGLELLCVSQFTLYCQLKGNKPDYRHAMGGEEARALYQQLVDRLRTDYSQDKVKDGLFAAYMQVSVQNDGPVTITLESPSSGGGAETAVADTEAS